MSRMQKVWADIPIRQMSFLQGLVIQWTNVSSYAVEEEARNLVRMMYASICAVGSYESCVNGDGF